MSMFTERITRNSLERNLNYDKSLEMMILNKDRKLFKMFLFSLALLSQQESNFSVFAYLGETAMAHW